MGMLSKILLPKLSRREKAKTTTRFLSKIFSRIALQQTISKMKAKARSVSKILSIKVL